MKLAVHVFLLWLLATPLSAATIDWQWMMGDAYFGVSGSASDDLDSQDHAPVANPYWYVAVYREPGVDGWTADPGFYSTDIRSPIPQVPGQTKTWRFYFWADQACPYDFMEFQWGYYRDHSVALGQIVYTLSYVRAAVGGDAASMPVGTVVSLKDHQQGTWRFPLYKTDDGRNGYVCELTATVIPEPSSLAALACGLAGVGGALVRRKQRCR